MKREGFWIAYVLLLVAQLLLSNYFHVSQYVMITLLPVMVLCIPVRVNQVLALLIAGITGLAVDYLSDGVLGLNALALLPVAFARESIIRLFFGREFLAREDDFSVSRCGFGPVAMAILSGTFLFLLIYIWADGAGTRPLWFNAVRLAASLAASFVVSLLTLGVLAPDTRR